MKQVEFTALPPKYEVCKHDGKAIIRFYCDGKQIDREDDQVVYTCTCYEMETTYTENLAGRIENNYQAWLSMAMREDGGLDAIKAAMNSESKHALAAYLAAHPLTSTAHGGKSGVYAVTEEKQALMTSQYISYQAEKAVNADAKLTWNESGKACEVWSEEEFLQLIIEVKRYVYPLVSHQQKIEEEIAAANTLDELDSVVIGYDDVH